MAATKSRKTRGTTRTTGGDSATRGDPAAGEAVTVPSAQAAAALRHFTFSEGTSQKFWEIAVSGATFTTRHGRIGAAGTETVKSFASSEEASSAADKLVREKLKKGYTERSPEVPAEQAQKPPRTSDKKQLAAIRKLLGAADLETVVEGLELLRALDDPGLWKLFAEGIYLERNYDDGYVFAWEVLPGYELNKRVRAPFRDVVVLHVADGAGLLDGASLHCSIPGGCPLPRSSRLRGLRLREAEPAHIRDLAQLTGLTSLSIEAGPELRDLSGLSGLSALTSLSLEDCPKLTGLSGLSGLGGLKSLSIEACSELRDLSGLAGLSGLTSLAIKDCTRLKDVSVIAGLGGLRSLSLRGCAALTDVSALARLTGLQLLCLAGCKGVTDREALAARKATWQEGEDAVGRWGEARLGGMTMRFRYVAPGSFLMGAPEGEKENSNERPQHEVQLTKGFWLGETPVTQRQWEAVMGDNPSEFKGADRPVEEVSWEDCVAFVAELSAWGVASRLPTEAEWEYACRAGTTGPTYLGDNDEATLDRLGWYEGNSGDETHPVGQKAPNAWGLHDMLGNVSEWCADWYADYPSGPQVDPKGPSSGSNRVVRGGYWSLGASYLRAAGRGYVSPGARYYVIGFRVARSSP
jgi:sulfatase modifying factor 1